MDPRLSDARAPVISKLAAFLFFFSSIFSRIFLLPTVPHIKLINSRFVYLKHLKRTRLRMISAGSPPYRSEKSKTIGQKLTFEIQLNPLRYIGLWRFISSQNAEESKIHLTKVE